MLIVDDEPLIRWSIAETLGPLGHTVSEAGDAKETLEQLSSGVAPDVILLDYRLPDSNDLTLLETIRSVVPGSAVIMMTGYGAPEVQTGAMRLGVFCILGKPVDLNNLAGLIETAYGARPHV